MHINWDFIIAFVSTDYNLQEPFHDSPNEIVTNNRIKIQQITEQNYHKLPNLYKFFWWFAIKVVSLRPKQ